MSDAGERYIIPSRGIVPRAEACLPAAAIASPSTVIILQPAVGAQISIVIEPPRPTLPDGS